MPEPEFDQIADELYALRPDAFAAARDEHIKRARAGGRQPLARELAQLRRPTQSAWLINLLWRDQREVMQQFFQLAEELSRAQAEAAGSELRGLTVQRRQLEAALVRQARALAEQAGVSVTDSTEREAADTLSAALALSEVADEIRTGRLVKPASYAGFGTPVPGGAAAQPAAARPLRAPPEATAAPEAKAASEAKAEPIDLQAERRERERREQAERRAREERAQAERAAQEARAALEAAEAALSVHSRTAQNAGQQHQALQKQLEALREQLQNLQAETAVAEQAAQDASQRRDQAERAHEQAKHTLDAAEQRLRATT